MLGPDLLLCDKGTPCKPMVMSGTAVATGVFRRRMSRRHLRRLRPALPERPSLLRDLDARRLVCAQESPCRALFRPCLATRQIHRKGDFVHEKDLADGREA